MANALNKVNSGGIEDGSIVNADVKSDAAIAGSKLVAATTSVPGSMSAADKTKLDGIATSATANPSAPALTGSTDNTITTVTGANAIQGEANLTFDGNKLSVTPNKNSNNDGFEVVPADGTTASSFKVLGNNNAGADGRNGGATFIDANYYATGSTIFNVAGRGTNVLEVFGNGNVEISDGDLVIGTNGHGIDFSATADGSGTMSSELLDDYEEGSWTPVYNTNAVTASTYSNTSGDYTKVGNLVTFTARVQMTSSTVTGSNIYLEGLPFTSSSLRPGGANFVFADNWGGSGSGDTAPITMYIGGNWSKILFYDGDGSALNADNVYDGAKRLIHIYGFYYA
tara:strand:+ start:2745 stop:3767 length:1023 start_codon:yes stop_codon:yes gene_type:complete